MHQSNMYEGPRAWRDTVCSILTQLPGLVLVKSLDSRILAINPALAALLGVRADAAVVGNHHLAAGAVFGIGPTAAPGVDGAGHRCGHPAFGTSVGWCFPPEPNRV